MSLLHGVAFLRLTTYMPSEVAFRILFPSKKPKVLKDCLVKSLGSRLKAKNIHFRVAEPKSFGGKLVLDLMRLVQPSYPEEGAIAQFLANSSKLPHLFPPTYYSISLSLEGKGVLLTAGTRKAPLYYVLVLTLVELLSTILFYLFLYMAGTSLPAFLCLTLCLFALPNLMALFFLVCFVYAVVVLTAESSASAEFLDIMRHECESIGDSCGVSGRFV